LSVHIVREDPSTELSKDGRDILLNSLNEICEVKVKDVLDEILNQDTDHPDLLILHEADWTLVKSVFSESS
jgi:hypothetical protein